MYIAERILLEATSFAMRKPKRTRTVSTEYEDGGARNVLNISTERGIIVEKGSHASRTHAHRRKTRYMS